MFSRRRAFDVATGVGRAALRGYPSSIPRTTSEAVQMAAQMATAGVAQMLSKGAIGSLKRPRAITTYDEMISGGGAARFSPGTHLGFEAEHNLDRGYNWDKQRDMFMRDWKVQRKLIPGTKSFGITRKGNLVGWSKTEGAFQYAGKITFPDGVPTYTGDVTGDSPLGHVVEAKMRGDTNLLNAVQAHMWKTGKEPLRVGGFPSDAARFNRGNHIRKLPHSLKKKARRAFAMKGISDQWRNIQLGGTISPDAKRILQHLKI